MTFGQMSPFISKNSDKKMQLDTTKLKAALIENKGKADATNLKKIETKLNVIASLEADKSNLIDIGLNNL